MTGSAPEPVAATIALGSNLGPRRAHLEYALATLESTPGVTLQSASSFVETEPEGGPPGQGAYLNGVACLETTLSARELLELLLAIETRRGRERSPAERWAARTLDLDLLFFGALELDEPGLILPHPRAEERTFVLRPLAELEPDRVLAHCGRTVVARLAELETRVGS